MARNQRLVRVAAGGGDVAFAPVGTRLPTRVDEALDSAFTIAGYLSEDGIAVSYTPEITEHRSFQSKNPIRRDLTATDIAARFTMLQFDPNNLVFVFGGGTVRETSTGFFTYEFPDDDATLNENALILSWKDGEADYRLVLPRGNVSEGVETSVTRTEMQVLPVTFRALGGVGLTPYILTNDPEWEVGS